MAGAANWLEGWPDQETVLLELEKEYTRLFVNAYPKAAALPYSSVYLDKECLVWGRSTAEVARLYESVGLSINEDFHDLPDHIAAELEFASHLITEQLKGDQDGPPATQHLSSIEKRFLSEHLCRWAPLFFNRVAEQSVVSFYQAMAELAHRFVKWEAQRLRDRQ